MIEAVNSAVASAPALRAQAEQASAARSFTANPERTQEVVQAPYVSPYISMDIDHNKAVLQIRDGDTGDVLKQFPSDTALEFRSRQVARQTAKPVEVLKPETETEAGTVETADVSVPQVSDTPAPSVPTINPQAQIAAAALETTAAQAAAVSAPPKSGNVVVTA